MGPPPPPPPPRHHHTGLVAAGPLGRHGPLALGRSARPSPPLSLALLRRRLAEEIEVKLDLQALRELQPLEELRQRLRSSDF